MKITTTNLNRIAMNLKFIVLVLSLYLSINSSAQTPETHLEKLRAEYKLEKISIHTDKLFYLSGDTIWLKAYVMADDRPSTLSTKISVTLLNDAGNVAGKLLLPVQYSTAYGNIVLDPKLPGGTYSLQAYTNHMALQDKNNFYNRSLQIVHPTIVDTFSKATMQPRFEFFPETGKIVEGIYNSIAFKSTDQFGAPANAKVAIVNADGEDVNTFETSHNGMGKFRFKPDGFLKYYARVNYPNGTTLQVPLPVTKQYGMVAEYAINENDIVFAINNEKVETDIERPAYFLLTSNNFLLSKTPLATTKLVTGKIPTNEFPSGILTMTIFNANHQPLSERLFFVNNREYATPVNFDVRLFSNTERAQNSFVITAPDTTVASYSVAVTDAGYTQESFTNNIMSDFLITEELKGYIHEPAQYVADKLLATRRKADLIMMTNGWRRYNWDVIMNDRLPKLITSAVGYMNFTGVLKNKKDGTVVPNAEIQVLVKDTKTVLGITNLETDENGKYAVENIIVQDTMYIEVLGVKDSKLKKLNIRELDFGINSQPVNAGMTISPLVTVQNKIDYEVNDAAKNAISFDESKSETLTGVKVEASRQWKAKQETNDKYTQNTLFSSGELRSFDFVNEPLNSNPTQTVFDYIVGRAPGVRLENINGHQQFSMRSTMSLAGGLLPMTIVLDNVQVTPSMLRSIPMRDVAIIKIFSSNLLFSSQAGGIIAVFSKRGDDYKINNAATQYMQIKLPGFSPIKEFYSPDYSQPATNGRADKRTTLYWNPSFNTSAESREAKINFYNNDYSTRFKVVIQGFNADGKMFFMERFVEK